MIASMVAGFILLCVVGWIIGCIAEAFPSFFETDQKHVWERYLKKRIRDAPDEHNRALWQAAYDQAKAEGRI